MKKTLISILILFSAFNLFAQIEKGHFLLTGFGNYGRLKSTNQSQFEPGMRVVTTLNTGGSIGFFFSDRFIAGAGIEYNLEKDGPSFGTGKPPQGINYEFRKLLPYAYLGYYLPIVPKLYFNTNIKLMVGQYSEYPIAVIEYDYTEYTGNYAIYKINYVTKSMGHFEAQITPELSYFIAKHVGVYLGFGGFSYTMQDWDTNQSGWLISVQPTYWKVGIKIAL